MTSNEIILNNKKAAFKSGETILSVARREGIRIPTLCSHEALAPPTAHAGCVLSRLNMPEKNKFSPHAPRSHRPA